MKLIKIKIFTFLIALFLAPSAFSLDLKEAREKGMFGEKRDGTIEVMINNAEAVKLAEEINSLRLQEYQKISSNNGQPLDVVRKIAFKQIVENLPAGSYYKNEAGTWTKK